MKDLIQILRESNTYSNMLIERFLNEYGYDNFRAEINEEYLKDYLIREGYLIKIAGVEPMSAVDGPGLRYTIFTQGCNHNCKGCHNPQTHDYYKGGYYTDIIGLYNKILENKKYIKGVTFSGGDPLFSMNYQAVYNLCELIKNTEDLNLDIWLYTGSDWDFVKQFSIVQYLDVVVDGEFMIDLKSLNLKFRGSSNQRLINVKESLLKKEVVEWDQQEHI